MGAMKSLTAILLAFAIGALGFVAAPEARAQDAVADFYKGKTVTIVIGSTPGGGYDTYARLIARHIGKYIPGRPAVAPSNMPGAGSNVAAAAVYNTLPKDGTQIGAIYASAMLEPLLGDAARIRHDPSKLQTLGSASNEIYTCVVRNDAPIKTLADARATEIILGATANGGSTGRFSRHPQPLLRHQVQDRARLCRLARGAAGDGAQRGAGRLRPDLVGALDAISRPVHRRPVQDAVAGRHDRDR